MKFGLMFGRETDGSYLWYMLRPMNFLRIHMLNIGGIMGE